MSVPQYPQPLCHWSIHNSTFTIYLYCAITVAVALPTQQQYYYSDHSIICLSCSSWGLVCTSLAWFGTMLHCYFFNQSGCLKLLPASLHKTYEFVCQMFLSRGCLHFSHICVTLILIVIFDIVFHVCLTNRV